jgi:osmoprotectant transport system substrate-binding protein
MPINRREFLSGTLLLLAGCASKRDHVTVGTKNFTEQLVLGEILAQALERAAVPEVDRRFYLAGTYICHQALLAGRIDMYVEYTGTALAAILKEHPPADHNQVYTRVRDEYRRRFALEVMPPLGFNNSFAMVMRGADARRLRLKTLSDLAASPEKLRIGVGYEFVEREDGLKGLMKKYNLQFRDAPRIMDLGLIYRALQNNQVDIVAGSNTDGLIAALDLVALDDDLHYFPPYDAVTIVRSETLQRRPDVRTTLDRLAGRLTAEKMRSLNYAVDGEKQDAAIVAKNFLSGM